MNTIEKQIYIVTSSHLANDIRVFQKEALSIQKLKNIKLYYMVPHAIEEEIQGVKILPVSLNRAKYQRLIINPFVIFFRLLFRKVNVIHFHDPELMPFILLLQLLKNRVKVVYDIHEDLEGLVRNRNWIPLKKENRNLIAGIAAKYERFFVKRFHTVIAADHVIASRCIAVNTNTIVLENFPKSEEYIHNSREQAPEEFIKISSFGGLSNARCIETIISAIEILSEAHKVKCIVGGSIASQELFTKLQNSKAWAHVEYIGKVDRERMAKEICTSHLSFVMFSDSPNHYQIRSNRFYETLSFGVPVICSDFPEWKQFMEQHNCGFACNPNNAMEVASSIEQIIMNPSLRSSLGDNGRNVVLNKYNWEIEEKKLINLYNNLLKEDE